MGTLVERLRAFWEDPTSKERREGLAAIVLDVARTSRVLFGLDADRFENVVQNASITCLRAFESRRFELDVHRDDPATERKARSYVLVAVRRKAQDERRSNRRSTKTLSDDQVAAGDPPPVEQAIQNEEAPGKERRLRLLQRAVRDAPPKFREVLERAYFSHRPNPIRELVEERYEKKLEELRQPSGDSFVWTEDDAKRLRKRIRDTIDQNLSRGRKWLRRRVRELEQEEEPS